MAITCTRTCTECNKGTVKYDEKHAEYVCKKCGAVLSCFNADGRGLASCA